MRNVKWVLGTAGLALALAACGGETDRAADDAADAAEATTSEETAAAPAEAGAPTEGGEAAPAAAGGGSGGKGGGDGAAAAPAAAPAAGAGGAAPRGGARTSASAIDFGDDSSEWANDGECDDPRFVGSNMAEVLLDEDTGKDATDCRAAFEQGLIGLRG